MADMMVALLAGRMAVMKVLMKVAVWAGKMVAL